MSKVSANFSTVYLGTNRLEIDFCSDELGQSLPQLVTKRGIRS